MGCSKFNHLVKVFRVTILDNFRLRNDLYCVEWDVKLYYTIPYLDNLIQIRQQHLLGYPTHTNKRTNER